MQLVSGIEVILQSPERMGELVGLTGAFIYIGGFFLVQSGRICGNSIAYPLSKVIAAGLVLVSLLTAFNLAACVIQIAYAGIGIYGVARKLRKDQGARGPVLRHARRQARITRLRGHAAAYRPRATMGVLE